MRALDLIIKKRNGENLSDDEICFLIDNFTNGNIPEYQMAAFAMAAFFQKLSGDELKAMTQAMLHSGQVLDFSELDKPAVDKHSTGGVGDKVSIPLAPAVAACGVLVPMISGRGLGHTGGTLDKLESIPGFSCKLSIKEMKSQIENIGCFLGAATKEIAPADKKFYELRDVTGTVECLQLIAASILSKKLAEGTNALFFDVKHGSGAFMKSFEDATKLGEALVQISKEMGTPCSARMSSMEQPLGVMIGNSLEIEESLDILKNQGPSDTRALVVECGAEMLVLGKVSSSLEQGREKIVEVLQNGKAFEKFAQIVEVQGGDPKSLEAASYFNNAPNTKPLLAAQSGYIGSMNTYDIGIASCVLGGGRGKQADVIDPRVGIEMKVKIGDQVNKGDPLCILHHDTKGLEEASGILLNAICVTDKKTEKPVLLGKRIT